MNFHEHRRNIKDVAEAFRLAARARTDEEWSALAGRFAPDSDAAGYVQRIAQLEHETQTAVTLKGLQFGPLFLYQGLRLAQRRYEETRRFVLEVLATGLTTFVDYFVFIAARDHYHPSPEQLVALGPLQKRFFAYCLAQLTEAGMDQEDIFMAMKLDTLDMESSVEVHGWQKKGREAILASKRFTPAEQALWKAVFENEDGAWERLRQHLVKTYQLPFQPAPPAPLH